MVFREPDERGEDSVIDFRLWYMLNSVLKLFEIIVKNLTHVVYLNGRVDLPVFKEGYKGRVMKTTRLRADLKIVFRRKNR